MSEPQPGDDHPGRTAYRTRAWAPPLGIAALLAGLVAVSDHEGVDDCPAVDAMVGYTVDYAQQQNERITQIADSDDPNAIELASLEQWAHELRQRADTIHNPGLRGHAERLADLADQTTVVYPQVVEAVEDFVARHPQSVPDAQSSLRELAEVNQAFDEQLAALVRVCPGAGQ